MKNTDCFHRTQVTKKHNTTSRSCTFICCTVHNILYISLLSISEFHFTFSALAVDIYFSMWGEISILFVGFYWPTRKMQVSVLSGEGDTRLMRDNLSIICQIFFLNLFFHLLVGKTIQYCYYVSIKAICFIVQEYDQQPQLYFRKCQCQLNYF